MLPSFARSVVARAPIARIHPVTLPALRSPSLNVTATWCNALTTPVHQLQPHLSRSFTDKISHATTILSVRSKDKVVMVGDGQVTQGSRVVLKENAVKVRKIGNGSVIVGVSGSVSDALTLVDLLEEQLERFPSQLTRAGVELAKQWRHDKILRRLDAQILAVDRNVSLQLDGSGTVIESPDILATGSGGDFARAAATALVRLDSEPPMDPMDVAKRAMTVAADMCVYTNHNFVVESIDIPPDVQKKEATSGPVETTPSSGAPATAASADQSSSEDES